MPAGASSDPIAESLALAFEQARYWRKQGVTPAQAICAVGGVADRRCGWDDAIWQLGAALYASNNGSWDE